MAESGPHDEPERGAHNEIGFRNVDEEGEYDEGASQRADKPEQVNEGTHPSEPRR